MENYKYFLCDGYEVVASFQTKEEVWDVIHSLGLKSNQYIYMKKEDNWYFPGDSNLSIFNYDFIQRLNKAILGN